MANLIYACWRTVPLAAAMNRLEQVADHIRPDPLPAYPHLKQAGETECLIVTGPQGAVGMEASACRLGAFSGPWPQWYLPGTPMPEGSFALVRSNESTVEICSDYAGSRTLWYAFDENRLLVSTSQRALICLLEHFSLNQSALAWYLSSGSLGPVDSWDERINRLPRGACLQLDRQHWDLQVKKKPLAFQPLKLSWTEAQHELQALLDQAISRCDFSQANWVLPLSGGHDSRFLLATLCKNGFKPRTVTWGRSASQARRGNDAFIAPQVARHFQVRHDYYLTERSDQSPEALVDLFLQAHGGTTDALFPYLDGLRLWSQLAIEGVDGIIRGDEGFGVPAAPAQNHRFYVGLILLEEVLGIDDAEAIAGKRLTLPEDLCHHPEESLQTYGDRLLLAHCLPVLLAGLSDVKTPFVEVASPMLSESVLKFIQVLPDNLRSGRILYENMVRAMPPAIPIACLAADDAGNSFLTEKDFGLWIHRELTSDFSCRFLPQSCRLALIQTLHQERSGPSLACSAKALIKRLLPSSWIYSLKAHRKPTPPSLHSVAFRCALASRLATLLEKDAAFLSR